MCMLRKLSEHGDASISWAKEAVVAGDPEAIAAIHEAERIFAQVRASGWSAWRVARGVPAERISMFDPNAEQILLIPPVKGG